MHVPHFPQWNQSNSNLGAQTCKDRRKIYWTYVNWSWRENFNVLYIPSEKVQISKRESEIFFSCMFSCRLRKSATREGSLIKIPHGCAQVDLAQGYRPTSQHANRLSILDFRFPFYRLATGPFFIHFLYFSLRILAINQVVRLDAKGFVWIPCRRRFIRHLNKCLSS